MNAPSDSGIPAARLASLDRCGRVADLLRAAPIVAADQDVPEVRTWRWEG